MSATDGGPAYPCSNEQFTHGNPQTGDAWSGMSLRDYFAAKAMQAIILADGIQFASAEIPHAEFAYRQADAMLKARQP